MICKVCDTEFSAKNKIHIYCSSYCRNYERYRSPTRKEQMKGWRRKSQLKQLYGLTLTAYQNMLDSQNGGCFLCGNGPRGKRNLAVDHCHLTGRVRGLLCDPCNRYVIGNRDAVFFKRCVDYLEPKVNEA